jgi:hypothetical protein
MYPVKLFKKSGYNPAHYTPGASDGDKPPLHGTYSCLAVLAHTNERG